MKKKLFFLVIALVYTGWSQTTHIVNAGNFYYSPSEIVINQGDIVIWINDGGMHDVNAEVNSITNIPFDNPESFDSPSMNEIGGEIYSHQFNVPGTYNYDCSVGSHADNGMVGTIVVNPSLIGLWFDSESNQYIEITQNQITIFSFLDEGGFMCWYGWSMESELQDDAIFVNDPEEGVQTILTNFLENGDLQLLFSQDDTVILSPLQSFPEINLCTTPTNEGCEEVQGQWVWPSSNNPFLWMEIFDGGINLWTSQEDCVELTQLSFQEGDEGFCNLYVGEDVFWMDFGQLSISDDEQTLTFSSSIDDDWPAEIWLSSSFDSSEFTTCNFGCTDSSALNYDDLAIEDDGSCCYIAGCTDSDASNYNSDACFDDDSCIYSSNLDINNNFRKIVKTFDLLGRSTDTKHTFKVYIYDDGSIEKRIFIK